MLRFVCSVRWRLGCSASSPSVRGFWKVIGRGLDRWATVVGLGYGGSGPFGKLTVGAKQRMTDRRKGDADKKKEKRRGDPPILDPNSCVRPINPDTCLEYLCAYGMDPLKSQEAINNLLQMEKRYGEERGRYEKLKKEKDKVDDKLREVLATIVSQKTTIGEMSISYRKAKFECIEKHAKLCDYRKCVKRANETIRGMKEDLRDNVVDMFLVSEEFYKNQEKTFDRAVKEVIESRVREEGDPVNDISRDFMEEPVSDDELVPVSSDDDRFNGGDTLSKGKKVRHG
ncbi:hypothetical protein LWI28_014092 [Acer negundo]|uniref:Uncharacterized protein n=1 Tax=Acer negundo TaxID=4023 RepID=A0AAD5P1R3_ACENE|nr:hypothetical protein LWI28_014092 [Acer negundo]